jgi:outer membrane protein assembly factor BamE
MLSSRSLPLLLTLSFALVGCSSLQFPGVHRVQVQQGNIITQDMIDQLRPGMTKSQVRYVMGTPLIADSFHHNRWDYFYSLEKADGEELREQVSIYFDNDVLSGFSGDYVPTSAKPAPASNQEEPVAEEITL